MIKRIHQIWLGKNPIPEKFLSLMRTVREQHPDWDYTLWTDEMIPANFVCNSIDRLICKIDVLRHELVYYYGGLYLDSDIQCFSSMDSLVEGRPLYLTKMEFCPQTSALGVCGEIAVLGAAKAGHPAILEYLRNLNFDKIENPNVNPLHSTGNFYVSRIFNKYPDYSQIYDNNIFRHCIFNSWVNWDSELWNKHT